MEFQIERFKKLISEVIIDGYGEVDLRVVIKNGQLEYINLSKSNIFKPLKKE